MRASLDWYLDSRQQLHELGRRMPLCLKILVIGMAVGLWGLEIPNDLFAHEAEEHTHFVVVDRDGKYLGMVVEIEEGEARVNVLREVNERTVLFAIVGQTVTGSYQFYLAYATPDCSGHPYLPLPTKVSSLVEQSIVEGQTLYFTAMDHPSTITEQGRKPVAGGTCFNLARPNTSGSPYGALPGQSATTTIHAVPFSGTFDLAPYHPPYKVVAR